jgi:hypothetical protein
MTSGGIGVFASEYLKIDFGLGGVFARVSGAILIPGLLAVYGAMQPYPRDLARAAAAAQVTERDANFEEHYIALRQSRAPDRVVTSVAEQVWIAVDRSHRHTTVTGNSTNLISALTSERIFPGARFHRSASGRAVNLDKPTGPDSGPPRWSARSLRAWQ